MILQLGYSKQVPNRMESLLMIVPAIVLIITYAFTKIADLDTQYQSTYFSFSFANIGFFSWSLLIIPFILHLFLKQQKIGSENIIVGHIVVSLLLLITVFFTYQLYIPINQISAGSFWSMPYQHQWMEATIGTYILITSQFLIQIVFSVYAINKLIP